MNPVIKNFYNLQTNSSNNKNNRKQNSFDYDYVINKIKPFNSQDNKSKQNESRVPSSYIYTTFQTNKTRLNTSDTKHTKNTKSLFNNFNNTNTTNNFKNNTLCCLTDGDSNAINTFNTFNPFNNTNYNTFNEFNSINNLKALKALNKEKLAKAKEYKNNIFLKKFPVKLTKIVNKPICLNFIETMNKIPNIITTSMDIKDGIKKRLKTTDDISKKLIDGKNKQLTPSKKLKKAKKSFDFNNNFFIEDDFQIQDKIFLNNKAEYSRKDEESNIKSKTGSSIKILRHNNSCSK